MEYISYQVLSKQNLSEEEYERIRKSVIKDIASELFNKKIDFDFEDIKLCDKKNEDETRTIFAFYKTDSDA